MLCCYHYDSIAVGESRFAHVAIAYYPHYVIWHYYKALL